MIPRAPSDLLRRLRLRPIAASAGFLAEATLGEPDGGLSAELEVRARASIGRVELAILTAGVVLVVVAIVAIMSKRGNALDDPDRAAESAPGQQQSRAE